MLPSREFLERNTIVFWFSACEGNSECATAEVQNYTRRDAQSNSVHSVYTSTESLRCEHKPLYSL